MKNYIILIILINLIAHSLFGQYKGSVTKAESALNKVDIPELGLPANATLMFFLIIMSFNYYIICIR